MRGNIDPHVYTALPIAASRALANGRPGSLINDPLAQTFLNGHEDLLPKTAANTNYMTNDLVTQQYRRGVRQVVSLGAGVDSRAFRLPLNGTTFYEVDKEDLFRLKEPIVQDVPLTCARRVTGTGVLGEMDLVMILWRNNGLDPAFRRQGCTNPQG